MRCARIGTILLVASCGMAAADPNTDILSGDWVSDCRVADGAILCERHGGFLSNRFPAGCDAPNLFVCRGIDICDLARVVYVIDSRDYHRSGPEVAHCKGRIRRPPSR